jgi:hypothetical protein
LAAAEISELGYRLIDQVAILWRLQKIHRYSFWYLSLLSPLSDGIEILAFVLGIEVNEGSWHRWIPPYLSEKAGVWLADKLLTNDI